MKKIFAFLLCSLAFCGFVFAQSKLPELDKVKEIQLLESKRKEVKRILADYERDDSDDDSHYDLFSTENAEIEVTYSAGNCSEEDEFWNVDEWTVTQIEISFENAVKVEDAKFNFSNFTKEVEDEEFPEDYIYQNENLGIAFKIDDNKIESIYLFPSKGSYSLLCDNENTKEIFSGEKRLVDTITRYTCILVNKLPTVDDLILDTTEITADCANSAENKSCLESVKKISVTTVSSDPENDPLTYNYTVSGGKIIGNGAKVIWDLTGVKAGTYTITAGANDGAGISAATKTQTVIVKECSDCAKEKPSADTKNEMPAAKKP